MPCNKSRRILTGYLIERLVFIIAGKNVIPVQATCDIFWIREYVFLKVEKSENWTNGIAGDCKMTLNLFLCTRFVI